jgi:hypothetical protein
MDVPQLQMVIVVKSTIMNMSFHNG